DADTMLHARCVHLECLAITFALAENLEDVPADQNLRPIGKAHDTLSHVNSSACDVLVTVDISDAVVDVRVDTNTYFELPHRVGLRVAVGLKAGQDIQGEP